MLSLAASSSLAWVGGWGHAPRGTCAQTSRQHGDRVSVMVTASPAVAIPGKPSAADEQAFLENPQQFCASRVREHGAVFKTGAFGDATFVGEPAAAAALADAKPDAAALGAPFAEVGADGFVEYGEAFSDECYKIIFDWIPMYKEAGFSTFRFEDFIDGRVRKVCRAPRRAFYSANAPAPARFWVAAPASLAIRRVRRARPQGVYPHLPPVVVRRCCRRRVSSCCAQRR
eukprot:313496-Prymnesium_polylepis.1